MEVYVYTQYVFPDGTKDDVHTEYVTTTNADHLEIVKSLKLLFPTYVGCDIVPEGTHSEEE